MIVIPTVNALSFEEARHQLEVYAGFLPPGSWVQIDVADGVFSPRTTWNNPEEFKALKAQVPSARELRFEIHLMVQDSRRIGDEWLKAGADRLIVHVESKSEPFLVLGRCALNEREIMVAVNPATSIATLVPYLTCVSLFQILAVPPGPSGQKFDEKVLDKIRELRAKAPDVTIEVDGGITPETAKLVKDAGAGIVVSGSYVLNAPDPKAAYEELLKI